MLTLSLIGLRAQRTLVEHNFGCTHKSVSREDELRKTCPECEWHRLIGQRHRRDKRKEPEDVSILCFHMRATENLKGVSQINPFSPHLFLLDVRSEQREIQTVLS